MTPSRFASPAYVYFTRIADAVTDSPFHSADSPASSPSTAPAGATATVVRPAAASGIDVVRPKPSHAPKSYALAANACTSGGGGSPARGATMRSLLVRSNRPLGPMLTPRVTSV